MKKQDQAVLFIQNIGNDKIIKTYTRSTKQLINFVKKHDSVKKIYISPGSLTLGAMAQILMMNKKIVLLEPIMPQKIIKLTQ